MTLTKILENIQLELNGPNNSSDIDISFGKTSWSDINHKYICGIIDKDIDDDLDYNKYAFGSTIEKAIINFYNLIINNKYKHIDKITVHNTPQKTILNKYKTVTPNFNIRQSIIQ